MEPSSGRSKFPNPLSWLPGTANKRGDHGIVKPSHQTLSPSYASPSQLRAWAKTQRDETIAQVNSQLDRDSASATLASSSSESATLVSSTALGPLQKQALSRNNKAQSNSNKRGIATEDKENIQKRQKTPKTPKELTMVEVT